MYDLISRQAAIDALGDMPMSWADTDAELQAKEDWKIHREALLNLPSAKPTLYGYKIEHLAYIATVMEKEGVTAEYAVRTFDDMERVIKMVIEEARAKIEEAFNG